VKVFWAWQADLPGEISRHLIRKCLEEAIDRLKQPPDIEEPPDVSRRNDLHLDHDTKGLRGSPEIAHEIFKKIGTSTVVVADVTPIGRGPDRPPKDGKRQQAKPLINSNVAIELGYAYGKLGTDAFIPVLNKAYGDEDGLPFDIAHRRHPIEYDLKAGATTEEIEKEKKKLVEQFVIALKPYLANMPAASVPRFNEAQPIIGTAIYFHDGEVLAHSERPPVDHIMPFRSVFYMRVFPYAVQEGHLDIHNLQRNAINYGRFGLEGGWLSRRNKYGVIVGSPAGNTANLDAVLQFFRTGEIWGINAEILRQGEHGQIQYLHTYPLEEILIAGLQSAMRFHQEVSHIALPFVVEVGVAGVAGRVIAHTGYVMNSYSPVLASDTITHRAVLHKGDGQTLISFLVEFFEKLNKDAGVPRPKGLYGR
jgi:hypothetical protein